MQKIIFIVFLCTAFLATQPLWAVEKVIINKTFKSERDIVHSEPFAVSKGDVIEVSVEVDSKRRGLDVYIKQNPGDLIVFDYENLQTGTYRLTAPTDAIYQLFYGGAKVECDFKVIQHTDNPEGPGHGGIVYVQIPDTVHASGYVSHPIGSAYTVSPYVEKVIAETSMQPEIVCSRDFFTGVDIINLSIPGDSHDEYRDQKLLSYTVSLVCQSPGVYNKMKGLIETGIDEFTPSMTDVLSMTKKKKGSSDNDSNPNSQYKFTNNLEEEQSKWENVPGLLSLAAEGGNELGASDNVQAALNGMAFLADGKSVQHLAVHEGLKGFGAPDNIVSLVDKVYEMPSTADILNKGMNQLLPTVKGKAKIWITENRLVERPSLEFPQKTFWIQSAMNAGNAGGCWDVPGTPTSGKNGLDIKCWDIDNGADRCFKIVPAAGYPGYFKIESALPGGQKFVLDNQGGETRMQNHGNNLHLWSDVNTTSQLFRFEHIGNGRFKIYNYDGFIACLAGRSNKNGSNIHIWDDHQGSFTEWCLIDPVTKRAFVPEKSTGKDVVWENRKVFNETGGVITTEIPVARPNEPVRTDMAPLDIRLKITKEVAESKAKLMVEANYLITDYADAIRYRKEELPAVMTNDFWTGYQINYDYAIMFKDQLEENFKVISESDYNNPARPTSETIRNGDKNQKERLNRYKTLVELSQK